MGNRSYLYALDADNKASCILESNNNIPPFWLMLFAQPNEENIKSDSTFHHVEAAILSAYFSKMEAGNMTVSAEQAVQLLNRREQALVTELLPECRELFFQWKNYVLGFGATGFLLDFSEYAWFFDDMGACIRHLSDYMRRFDMPGEISRKKILEYAELPIEELTDPEYFWCIAGDSYNYSTPWGDQELDEEE